MQQELTIVPQKIMQLVKNKLFTERMLLDELSTVCFITRM